MSLFGSSDHLSWGELEEAIHKLHNLTGSEREYILGAFSSYRANGISKREIERVIRELKWNTNDPISEIEAKKVKEILLDSLS